MTLAEILRRHRYRLRNNIGAEAFDATMSDALAAGEAWEPSAADVDTLRALSPRVRSSAVGAILLGVVLDELEQNGPC